MASLQQKKQKKLAVVLEDDGNQKELVKDDDFVCRRMTRSALKQKLCSFEDDDNQQQKPRKGKKQKKSVKDTDDVEAPFISALKTGAENHCRQQWISKPMPDHSQKLGSLDNDENRKKLQRKWNQYDERWSRDEAQAYRMYKVKFTESEGFDVGDVTDNIRETGIIRPLRNFEQDPKMFEKLNCFSKLALNEFNKRYITNYQFVKVLKANFLHAAGYTYYITFLAKVMDGAVPENFQALVYAGIHETSVEFCRLEAKSKLLKGTGTC